MSDHEQHPNRDQYELVMPEPNLIERQMQRYRGWIDHAGTEGRTGQILVYSFLLMTYVLYCLAVSAFEFGPGWLIFAARVSIAGAAAIGAMSIIERMFSYRHGWVDGRASMAASFKEAGDRGMSARDWYDTEALRTLSTVLPTTGAKR